MIYCVDDADNKEINKFRYSQDQRRKETKKKYSKFQLKLKKEKINGKGTSKTIIKWETELTKLNRKSLNITKFKGYIQQKVK